MKVANYQDSRKSIQWQPFRYVRTVRRPDVRDDDDDDDDDISFTRLMGTHLQIMQ